MNNNIKNYLFYKWVTYPFKKDNNTWCPNSNRGLIISLILVIINDYFYNYDYFLDFNVLSLAKTCVVLFAEAVIGGLVIDYFIKKVEN